MTLYIELSLTLSEVGRILLQKFSRYLFNSRKFNVRWFNEEEI